jgi:hypothetical protein
VRMKRVLRGFCSAELSGNSYLVIGAAVAVVAMGVPGIGPFFAAIIAALSALLAAGLIVTIVGAFLGPVVL